MSGCRDCRCEKNALKLLIAINDAMKRELQSRDAINLFVKSFALPYHGIIGKIANSPSKLLRTIYFFIPLFTMFSLNK